MNRQAHSLKPGFLLGLLVIISLACLVGDSYAQRRGGFGGGFGGGYSAPVYRPAPPRPVMPRQITPQGPRISGPAAPRPGVPGVNRAAGSTVRPLPPSIKPTSSVARIPSYTGRITTKGAPILVSRTGRSYSVPQQGIFSTRITTTYQTIKTSLVKKDGGGKVIVLQKTIAKVATGTKVVKVKIGGGGGSGSGAGSSANGGDGGKKGIKDDFNKAAAAWGDPKTLERHFADHGKDFGATSKVQYAHMATDFFHQSRTKGYLRKVAPNGIQRIYDPSTNTFGSYNPNGTTRTFFKPNPIKHGRLTNMDFWRDQPGEAQ